MIFHSFVSFAGTWCILQNRGFRLGGEQGSRSVLTFREYGLYTMNVAETLAVEDNLSAGGTVVTLVTVENPL